MVSVNVVNVITIGLIAVLFLALLKYVLAFVQSRRAASAS